MTSINNLGAEIAKAVALYTKEVTEEIQQAKEDVTDRLTKDLKADSPRNRPRYFKGWKVKKVKGKNLVYNKTDYQLTHLLEHGYIKRNGERQPPQVHIRPNEEKAIREYLKRVRKAVER